MRRSARRRLCTELSRREVPPRIARPWRRFDRTRVASGFSKMELGRRDLDQRR